MIFTISILKIEQIRFDSCQISLRNFFIRYIKFVTAVEGVPKNSAPPKHKHGFRKFFDNCFGKPISIIISVIERIRFDNCQILIRIFFIPRICYSCRKRFGKFLTV